LPGLNAYAFVNLVIVHSFVRKIPVGSEPADLDLSERQSCGRHFIQPIEQD